MESYFNYCELIIGLIIGIISSGIVWGFSYWYINRKRKKQLEKKYGRMEGEYDGYSFEKVDENNPSLGYKKILETDSVSEVEIKYSHDNILKITLTQLKENLVWEGYITMELENLGSVVWKYKNLKKIDDKEQYWFGLKRCIINEDTENNLKQIYLIGEKEEGFGKCYQKPKVHNFR